MISIGRLRKHLERLILDRAQEKLDKATTKMTRIKFNLEKITSKEKLSR